MLQGKKKMTAQMSSAVTDNGQSLCNTYSITEMIDKLKPPGLHSLRHTFATNLVNGVKQPDGTIRALSPRQVADIFRHSTSQITELYYVKKDTLRPNGATDGFEF